MGSNVSVSHSMVKHNTFNMNDTSEFPSPQEAADLIKHLKSSKENNPDNSSDLFMLKTPRVHVSDTPNVLASTFHSVSDASLSRTVVSQANSNSTPVQGVECLSVSDISPVAALDRGLAVVGATGAPPAPVAPAAAVPAVQQPGGLNSTRVSHLNHTMSTEKLVHKIKSKANDPPLKIEIKNKGNCVSACFNSPSFALVVLPCLERFKVGYEFKLPNLTVTIIKPVTLHKDQAGNNQDKVVVFTITTLKKLMNVTVHFYFTTCRILIQSDSYLGGKAQRFSLARWLLSHFFIPMFQDHIESNDITNEHVSNLREIIMQMNYSRSRTNESGFGSNSQTSILSVNSSSGTPLGPSHGRAPAVDAHPGGGHPPVARPQGDPPPRTGHPTGAGQQGGSGLASRRPGPEQDPRSHAGVGQGPQVPQPQKNKATHTLTCYQCKIPFSGASKPTACHICQKVFHKNHLSGKPLICFKCAGMPPPPLHPGTVSGAELGLGPGVTAASPRGRADTVPPAGQPGKKRGPKPSSFNENDINVEFLKKERNLAKAKIASLENELSEVKRFNTVLVSRLKDMESKISSDQFEQYFPPTRQHKGPEPESATQSNLTSLTKCISTLTENINGLHSVMQNSIPLLQKIQGQNLCSSNLASSNYAQTGPYFNPSPSFPGPCNYSTANNFTCPATNNFQFQGPGQNGNYNTASFFSGPSNSSSPNNYVHPTTNNFQFQGPGPCPVPTPPAAVHQFHGPGPGLQPSAPHPPPFHSRVAHGNATQQHMGGGNEQNLNQYVPTNQNPSLMPRV